MRSASSIWFRALREGAVGLFYIAVAQVVSASFLSKWGVAIAERLPRMLAFEVDRPFAFRVASPWLLGKFIDAAPRARLQGWLDKSMSTGFATTDGLVQDAAIARYRVPPEMAVDILLVDCFFVALLVLTAYVWRGMLRSFGLPRFVRLLAPGLFLLALPVHFAQGGYIYDFPELLLASLATWAFIEKRWVLFYPVLTLAVLNKEADLILCAFFLVFFLQRDWRRTCLHGALCVVFALAPFIATRLVMASHPGTDTIYHFSDNVAYLTSIEPLLGRSRAFSPWIPFPVSLNLILIVVTSAFVFHRFRQRPFELRVMLLATVASVLPLYIVYGYKNEMRVFSMCFPVALILAAHTFAELLAEPRTPEAEDPSGDP